MRINTKNKTNIGDVPAIDERRSLYLERLLAQIPKTWTVHNIGDLCTIKTGKLDVNQADEEGRYPFFTCAERIYRINTYAFDSEAILIAGNGFFNVKYYNGKFNAYQRTYVLSDIKTYGKYLYYYIDYRLRDITGESRGSTITYIRLGDLRDYPVAVAPPEQQRRIVAEIEKQFSRLDEAVANLRRVKTNIKRYKASVLKAAVEGKLTEQWRKEHPDVEPASKLLERILTERRAKWKGKGKYKEPAELDIRVLPQLPKGWTWTTLGEIAELKGGITKGQKRKPTDKLRKVPYLRVANVQRGFIDLTEVKDIEATKEEIAELALQVGDVLFNEGGDRDKLGRGWIWEGQIKECIHQNHVFRARPYSQCIEPKFLSWYGNSFGQQYFFDEGKHTTNLASINMTKLSGLPVPFPKCGEQQRIVVEVERRLSIVEELEKEVTINLQRAERLRQSILKGAFSGELHSQHVY